MLGFNKVEAGTSELIIASSTINHDLIASGRIAMASVNGFADPVWTTVSILYSGTSVSLNAVFWAGAIVVPRDFSNIKVEGVCYPETSNASGNGIKVIVLHADKPTYPESGSLTFTEIGQDNLGATTAFTSLEVSIDTSTSVSAGDLLFVTFWNDAFLATENRLSYTILGEI